MKLRIVLSAIALFSVGCTAFVAANLSNTNGTVENKLGGCFNLSDTTCGQCIANNCEDPTNPTQPVSLAKVCQLNQYSSIISAASECSGTASVSDYNCQDMFIDGGTYATSIDNEQAAVNNVKQCITQKCATSCSRCAVEVPTCGSDTIDLLEAGACGSCIDRMMNAPNGPCQALMLQGSCYAYSQDPIATCAVPSGSCQNADCTEMSSPDAGALYQCLWSHCGLTSNCPSP
jgi:hypothetical protein